MPKLDDFTEKMKKGKVMFVIKLWIFMSITTDTQFLIYSLGQPMQIINMKKQ